MSLLEPSDFETGLYLIAWDEFTSDDVQSFIDEEETTSLDDLLGSGLFADYEDEVTISGGEPTTQRFIDLVDGVTYRNTILGKKKIRAEGARSFLKIYTTFEYERRNNTRSTTSGRQRVSAENSEATAGTTSDLRLYWQTATRQFNKSYDFLSFYQEVKTEVVSFIESPAGTYEVTVGTGEVFYIFPTLEIDINGITFTVVSIDTVLNKVVATAISGLTITGQTITYNPFPDWEGEKRKFLNIT